MKVIIDRFEGDIAVLECNGEMLNAPAKLFENAKEGDHIEISVIKSADLGKEESEEAKRVGTENMLQATQADSSSQNTDGKDEKYEYKNADTKAIFERLRKKSKKAKD